MIKNYYLKAGRKRYHSRENWAKIGTTTSYGSSTLKSGWQWTLSVFWLQSHLHIRVSLFNFSLRLRSYKEVVCNHPLLIFICCLCTFIIWQEPHTECIPSIPHSYILENEKKQHLQQCANVLRKGVY